MKAYNKKWTQEEEKIVKDYYKRKTMQEMRELLPNRSADSIKRRARHLGIIPKGMPRGSRGVQTYHITFNEPSVFGMLNFIRVAEELIEKYEKMGKPLI